MPTQIESWNAAKLEPAQNPERARIDAAILGSSLTLAKGTVLGKKTSDKKLYAYAPVNDVQRVIIAGTLSGGTFRLRATKSDGSIVETATIAYNANDATITAALVAVLGTAAVTAVMDTNFATGLLVTFSGSGYAAIRQPLMSANINATTGATTTSVAHAATTTGVEEPVGILMHDVITDSNGKHYLGTSSVATSINLPHNDVSIYTGGIFDTTELTGWNTYCLEAFKARTLNSGYVLIP